MLIIFQADIILDLLKSYAAFLDRATELDLLDVDTFRSLLKGTDLAKALNTKPGPWMKGALDIVMAWQLRNPDATDPAEAIEAVKISRDKKNDSELPSRLASHFLQLTIPPFFPQSKSTANALDASRQSAPWESAGNQYILDLLRWSIEALNKKTAESLWHFLMPPILKMIDNVAMKWKARGCQLLGMLLQNLHKGTDGNVTYTKSSSPRNPIDFLQRSGYHNVFADTLLPLFAYLPSLTPEHESVILFEEVYPALTSLASLYPAGTAKTPDRMDLLDKILREGIMAPLVRLPTPSSYPELATTIVKQLPALLSSMGIESIKHLPSLLPLLLSIVKEPFVLSYQPLIIHTLEALQSVMFNSWPRIPAHRGSIMMGLCLLWERCVEDRERAGVRDSGEIEKQVKKTVAILDAVMHATEEREIWQRELQDVLLVSKSCACLLEDCRLVSA